MEITKNKAINRIYTILVVLFFATPFLFVLYGQWQQKIFGLNFQELLETNPQLNINFIVSFITPFIALYMLKLSQGVTKGYSKEFLLANLIIIILSFLIMGNITYALFVGILLYFINFEWKIGIKSISRLYKRKDFKWKEWVAPITLLFVAILVRLMLLLVSNV